MNDYAIFKLSRYKSSKDLADAYLHNERFYHVENADPLKIQDNIELIDTYGLSYEDLYNSTLAQLAAYGVPKRTIRHDAVKAFEVILSFSREKMDDIDIQQWAEKNLEWLDNEFNPPNHEITYIDAETQQEKTAKVQNLKHVIVHMDEESKPHIHAFIVPIDEKGNLNSHYYNSGRNKMIYWHNSYAKAMKEFGLRRGEEHSIATTEQMSRYYNHITKAVDATLPDVKEKETATEYKQRAEEVYQRALSNHRNEIVKKNQEIIHIQSQATKTVLTAKNDIAQERQLLNQFMELHTHTGETELEREQNVVQILKENESFKKALKEYPDEDFANETFDAYQSLIQWQLEQEKETERKEKEQQSKQR